MSELPRAVIAKLAQDAIQHGLAEVQQTSDMEFNITFFTIRFSATGELLQDMTAELRRRR